LVVVPAIGFVEMLAPVPTALPPQEPAYQVKEPPSPRVPPTTSSVIVEGVELHSGLTGPPVWVIPVGAMLGVLVVIEID
jgi:hypothetical protein